MILCLFLSISSLYAHDWKETLAVQISKQTSVAAFWKAVKSSDTAYVEKVLYGPNGKNWVNYRDTKQNLSRTPLMYAALLGSKPMVQLLLKYKADVNATDDKGAPALAYAVALYDENRLDIVRAICQRADLSRPANMETLHYTVLATDKDWEYEYILIYVQEYLRQYHLPSELLNSSFINSPHSNQPLTLMDLVQPSSPRTKKLFERLKQYKPSKKFLLHKLRRQQEQLAKPMRPSRGLLRC